MFVLILKRKELEKRLVYTPIIALYFEFENELKFYNLGARSYSLVFLFFFFFIFLKSF